MINSSKMQSRWRRVSAVAALLLAAAAPASAQTPFSDPQKAAEAFVTAVVSSDREAMSRLLGTAGLALVRPDEVTSEERLAFLEKWAQARSFRVEGRRADLVVGTDPWTLPIPLLQGPDGQWRFDAEAGRQAMLELRIGANERAAIQAVLAYVDAQREYALADRDGDGRLEYAQKLVSSPGRRDGLIWSQALGDESPLGEGFLPARPGQGYHGYQFRILSAQGPAAPGGERSYRIGGRMTNGFALIAWPVQYGKTGVMSFIVSQDGQVHQRDLGPGTSAAAAKVARYDPDSGWTRVSP